MTAGLRKTAALLALAVMFTGCSAPAESESGAALPDVVGSMDIRYAEQFSVDYLADGSALAEVADGRRYLIIPDGGEVPEQLPEDVTVISQPENIYLASSSSMDLFSSLDCLGDILASSTPESGWKLPEIAQAMADEDILYAGKYSSPDIELLMSEGCDLAIENMMIYHSPKTAEQIESCGIPVFIERSSAESHPLGRLEWVRLYGLMLGKSDEAEKFFSEKCSLLDEVTSRESTGCTAAFFYISSNGSAVVRKPGDYISKMIELAGGKYVFTAGDLNVDENALSSANIQFEAFYALAKDADCLIYNGTVDGGVDTLAQLTAEESAAGGLPRGSDRQCLVHQRYGVPADLRGGGNDRGTPPDICRGRGRLRVFPQAELIERSAEWNRQTVRLRSTALHAAPYAMRRSCC